MRVYRGYFRKNYNSLRKTSSYTYTARMEVVDTTQKSAIHLQFLKEFAAGCISGTKLLQSDFLASFVCIGVAQVIVGQPFDLVKVRLQAQPVTEGYKRSSDCVRHAFSNGGIGAFYKGNSIIHGVTYIYLRVYLPDVRCHSLCFNAIRS